MQPNRAAAILAVIRIIAVLGMALAISGGLFILIWGKLLLGAGVLLCFLPFFFLMRYMETHFADTSAPEAPPE